MPLIRLSTLLVLAGALAGARRPSDPDPGAIVFEGVTVVDVETGGALPDRTVLVLGGAIAAIGPAASIDVPADVTRIDGHGRWLIPGLWDMHVHLTDATERALPALVAWGVTGVRDAGGDLDLLDRWKAEIAAGDRVGPRIVRAGPYVDGYKPAAPYRLTVDDADDARAAVAYVQARGADFVKIHNGVPREAFFALAGEANERGIPFAGHVPLVVTPSEAARAGQASLEHAVTFFEGTFAASLPRDPKAMMDGLEAFLASGADTLAARLRAEGTYVTPTLVPSVLRGRRVELADHPLPCLETVAPSLKEQWDRFFPVTERDRAPGVEALRAAFAERLVAFTGILRAGGVPILAGTDLAARDVCPGVALHDELALLVDAGLEPIDALRSATIVPARFLGAADSLGSIAVGKRAELVLLEADPRVDVANTSRIVAVIADGRLYDRAALDAMLEEVRKEPEAE